MSAINKIYVKVLVLVLRWENLICGISSIVQSALIAVCGSEQFSPEVKKDLASKHQFCKTNTEHQINWGAPGRMAIGISY